MRPVREARVRRPHLLAGHDVHAAALLGARREAGEVAPGVRLAEQLAPDVVAGEDPRHPPPALRLGAVRHQRRPDEADAAAPEQRRCAGAGQLLVVDRDLRQRRAAPAVLDRPVDADPARRRGACAATRAARRPRRRSSRARRRAAGARQPPRAARRGTARRAATSRPGARRAHAVTAVRGRAV